MEGWDYLPNRRPPLKTTPHGANIEGCSYPAPLRPTPINQFPRIALNSPHHPGNLAPAHPAPLTWGHRSLSLYFTSSGSTQLSRGWDHVILGTGWGEMGRSFWRSADCGSPRMLAFSPAGGAVSLLRASGRRCVGEELQATRRVMAGLRVQTGPYGGGGSA